MTAVLSELFGYRMALGKCFAFVEHHKDWTERYILTKNEDVVLSFT